MADNSFLVNDMVRAYYGVLESQKAGKPTMKGMDFRDMVVAMDKKGGVASFSRENMPREEYRGDKWYTGFRGGKGSSVFEKEAEESFWEKRRKRHKKYIKLQEEMEIEKKVMEHVYQEAAIRRGDYENMFNFQGAMPMLPIAKLMLMADKKVK